MKPNATGNTKGQADTGRASFMRGVAERLIPKTPPLDSKQLCAMARRRTGLEDFGEPAIEPALTVLTSSLESEADLHPLGRFLMSKHLLGLLEARLRLTRQWASAVHEPGSCEVVRPIFITGMPRSGSTFLHELLVQEPSLRAPRVWEVMFPESAARPDQGWRDARIWKTAGCLWCFRRLVPKADAVYPVRARTPHECVAIQSHAFVSEEFVATCHVPTYEAFLRSVDLAPAYRWEKRLLQHLQVGRSPTRWLLKSPDHVHGLEALFSVFPDALIVQTHRNPFESLRSLIQLTGVLQGLYGKPRGLDEKAERETRNLAAAMARFIQFRDSYPELSTRFIDVNYAELVADPLRVVRRIFARFSMTIAEPTVSRIQQLALGRGAYKGRRTAPTLLEAGLHVPGRLSLFKEYCRRFNIPSGNAGWG
jgi:hypothetical protein